MTPEQKHKEIRAKVIGAVPEIVELKFGCQVKYQKEIWNVAKFVEKGILLAHIDGVRVTRFGDYQGAVEKYGVEIIGRPIRLADVLLAMEQLLKDEELILGAQGILALCKSPIVEARWNLRKDSLVDNPQCWDFLHSILCERFDSVKYSGTSIDEAAHMDPSQREALKTRLNKHV